LVISEENLFKRVVILFKSWCIPFDIVRLDEQTLDIYDFLGEDGLPLYGAIVLIASPEIMTRGDKLTPLLEAVNQHGIGLICLGDTARNPAVQKMLGIEWLGRTHTSGPIVVKSESFLTDRVGEIFSSNESSHVPVVKASETETIVSRGKLPLVTVSKNGRAVWICEDLDTPFRSQLEREWFRQAITEVIGYSLIKTWDNHILLRMDDPGTAQNSWLKSWHYPTLSRAQINEYIIEPLKKHNAKLSVFVSPGFVNDEAGVVEPSWKRCFVDGFGVMQDYRSTKAGLDDGVRMGLLEIQSHGWTHMQPDLESAPGPWWGAKIEGRKAMVGWYREFYDKVREQDVPASVQLRRMKISREWIHYQFGEYPVAFIPPGWEVSRSRQADTFRLASRAGFGWLDGYLGEDMVIKGWMFSGTEDVPEFKKVPPDGHDFGLTKDPNALMNYLSERGDAHYIGYSEYVAYLHANIRSQRMHGISLIIDFGSPLCTYLVQQPSHWDLRFSLRLQRKLRRTSHVLKINGEELPLTVLKRMSFSIPAGRRLHVVEVHSSN